MQLRSAREIAAENGLKMLVYGPAGAGKTSLIKTVPNQREVVVVDFEGGVLALADSDVLIVPVSSASELKQAIEELCQSEFKVIAFDGLSLFIRSRIQALLAESGKQRPTWQEWQIVTRDVRQAILPLLHSVGRIILFTSLSKVEYETVRVDGQIQSVPRRIRPDLPPAITHEIVAAMDLVGYLASPRDQFFKSDERTLLFYPPSDEIELVTKTRANVTSCPANLSVLLNRVSIDINSLKPKAFVLPQQRTSNDGSSADADQPQQAHEFTAYPRTPERAQTTQIQGSRHEMISEIFRIAKELGIDNKALGRLAKSMFGVGLIKELSDEHLVVLLERLRRQATEKNAVDVSKTEADTQTAELQAANADIANAHIEEQVKSIDELPDEKILDALLPDWREQPHAALLAKLDELFVPPEWTKELAEVMVAQAVVEVGLPVETPTAEALKDERVVCKLIEELG